MTFVFDLNRSVELTVRMRWAAPPLDTVMMLTALRDANPSPPDHPHPDAFRPRIAPGAFDDDEITWEDAEWR